MRYAHSSRDKDWIGVEPEISRNPKTILICDFDHEIEIHVRDKAQLEDLISLLMDASLINGWH